MLATMIPGGGGLLPYGGGMIPNGGGLLPKLVAEPDTLTLYADYTQPRQQAFPTTAAALAAFFDAQASDVAAIIPGDEPTGNLVDRIDSQPLVPTNSPLQGQICAGIFDGTDAYSKRCVEFEDADTAGFVASDTDWLEVNENTSIAIVYVVKANALPGGNRTVGGKKSGAGYQVELRSTGRVRVPVSDGTNIDNPAQNSGGIEAGEVGAIIWIMDRVGGEHHVLSTFGTGGGGVAITATGSLAVASGFAVGSVAGGAAAAPAQVLYTGVFLAADLSAMVANAQSNIDAFLSHATDPGGDTALFPALSIYTRASATACPIGDDPAYGLRIAKYGPGQFAHRYDADFSHATKLSMAGSDARTNLLAGSEALHDADWGDIGTPTVTPNAMEAADGSQTLATIAASGAAEGRDQTITVTAETEYTFQIFNAMRGIPGTDAFAEVEIYDADNAATIDTLQIDRDTDDLNADEALTFSTPTGCTSVEVRVRVDDGSTMGLGMVQVVLGKPTTYIPSPVGAAGTRVITDARFTNTDGDTIITAARGEIEIVYSCDSDVDGTRSLLRAANAADEKRVDILASGAINALVYDDSSVQQMNFSAADPGDHDQEHTVRIRYDSEEGVDGNAENADLIVDGVRTAGAAQAWTAGAGNTGPILASSGANQALNGGIAHVKAWNTPRPESV